NSAALRTPGFCKATTGFRLDTSNRQQSLEETTQIKLLRNMREWNKKRKAMRHYDRLAPVYDIQYGEEQNAKIEAALNNAKPGENELVLDLGCGTGLLFEQIAKSAKLVAGIDISSKILQEAKKRAKRRPNTAILRADADYTPFQNKIFNYVFAVTLLQNMPNPLKTLQEIKRVSNPQSTVIITGLKKKFSQGRFISLLNECGLNVSTLKTNPQLKGHIAICQNQRTMTAKPQRTHI
ncbi:MAG: class I SAM-dependent methyltransferase, partial [Candidatus Bathyarchaeia archaeon]